MTATRPPDLADLVLLRYALPGASPKKVRDDVGALLRGESLRTGEFDATRDSLAAAGLLTPGSRGSFKPSDAGAAKAAASLGFVAWPAGLSWAAVVKNHLFPKAAGLPAEAAGKLKSTDHLAAFVLKRKYRLSAGAGTKIGAVLEMLACRRLGYPQEVSLAGLLEAVLSQMLGVDKKLALKTLKEQLTTFETGVTKYSTDGVRHALVREWLAGASAPAVTFDLPAFAAAVHALAAASPPADRFYDNKVFIAPLWKASQVRPAFPRLTLPEFKARLVEANGRRLLSLSRADLVQAMDPALVAESETAHLTATFHFVLLEDSHP